MNIEAAAAGHGTATMREPITTRDAATLTGTH